MIVAMAVIELRARGPHDEPAPQPALSSGRSDPLYVARRSAHEHLGQAEVAEQLAQLGYVSGYERARFFSGIRNYDERRSWPGYNLYTSGHAPAATLMDMRGRTLHTWQHDIRPGLSSARRRDAKLMIGSRYFRRAHLFENGDLLALLDYAGLLKLDHASRPLWYRPWRLHHDMRIQPNGDILSLGEIEIDGTRLGFSERRLLDNTVVVMDRLGHVKRSVSLSECFVNTFSQPRAEQLLFRQFGRRDALHANSLDLVSRDLSSFHPALEKGRVLVSLRTPSLLALVDLEQERIDAVISGDWAHQHEARILPRGRILLFDNEGLGTVSRIVEIEPPTWKPAWSFEATPATPFFSALLGTQRRLPGGNTLVTESQGGRAFELTPDGEVVWEFVTPHHAPDDEGLVALLFDLKRLPADYPLAWLGRKRSARGADPTPPRLSSPSAARGGSGSR